MKRIIFLVGIISLLSIPLLDIAHAGPKLSRAWMSLNINKAKCIERAQLVMRYEKLGKLNITSDYVEWNNEKATGAIHCFHQGSNRSLTFIIVGGYRGNYTKGLRDIVYDQMKNPRFH